MEPLRLLIVDDEQPARLRLRTMLEKHADQIEIVGEASDGKSAWEQCRELKPDVAFLDIQMPPPNGLELAAELAEWEQPPYVIFLTAFSDHAVKAFEVRAIDYLVKPVSKERLAATLSRLQDLRKEKDEWLDAASEALQRAVPKIDYIERVALLEEITENRLITPVTEVDFFFSRDEKCFAQMKGQEYLLSSTLSRLEASLSPKDFLRTHRCFIVNINSISKVIPWFNGAYNIRMRDNSEVPLTRRRVADFKSLVDWT